jgi:hypothetical protein
MFKQFFTFRYSLSPNGRHNTLLVYADSPEVAEDKAIERLRADYPKGYTLFPQGRKVFATAEEADRACANGFFGSIAQAELAEFLDDYLNDNPAPIKAKLLECRSTFARELEGKARDFARERAVV